MQKHNDKYDHSQPVLSRRSFIASTSAGTVAAGLATNHYLSGRPNPPKRGKIRWRLQAQRIVETFVDGSSVPFFRYGTVGNTRSNGRLPLLRDRAGRKVAVSIENLVDFPIQPSILNYEDGPVIMPQESGIWEFTMPPVGTWIFTEALLGNLASSAGFGAAMVSIPAIIPKEFGRDYFLLYQDADDRWNNAIDTGNVPDESVFEPNYHTLNGLTYPQTMMDQDTRINCALGQKVLIRIANISNIPHALHFHGYHADLIRRNNQPVTHLPEKDTFPVPANSTCEISLPVTQVGEYPLHPHSLTSTTDNGTYQGGSVTMIDAQ
ncbi:MAG: multicopper oxidase domain-containing protein [Planctomycetota bacterium]